MEANVTSNDGLYSLGGFAFQIRAFILRLASLNDQMQIGFETFEDIGLRPVYNDHTIENHLDSCVSVLSDAQVKTAIQVKRSTVTHSIFKKVMYNWLILARRDPSVSRFILDTITQPAANSFDLDVGDMFEEIMQSDANARALVTKLKNLYNNDREAFEERFNYITERIEVNCHADIDLEIERAYERLLFRTNVDKPRYFLRIRDLINHFTAEIINAANRIESYTCTYESLCLCLEDIIKRISNEEYLPQFLDHARTKKIDFNDLAIATSRECIQLKTCTQNPRYIEKYLLFESYYSDYKIRNYENNMKQVIESIEDTTYDNFFMEKEYLIELQEDIPVKRLDGTLRRNNSYARNDQIRFGSAIHLTKETTPEELLISWKDDIEDDKS